MYDDLVKALRDCARVNSLSLYKRGLMKYAADTIEELSKSSKSQNGGKSEFKTIEKFESDKEIRSIRIEGLDVCEWKTFNGWKAKRVFADYPQNGDPRREVVVVLVREGDT